MLLQISSGQGPRECEQAVGLLFKSLQQEFANIELISRRGSGKDNCFTSILFRSSEDLSHLTGTIEWICKSRFRPHHKRKNWFVHVSVVPECEQVVRDGEIIFERFHCGGNGGQNVNKVETGVRLVHVPTGITVECTEERSQHQNRQRALLRLTEKLAEMENKARAKHLNSAWREHTRLVRGNPVRIYEGQDFKRRA